MTKCDFEFNGGCPALPRSLQACNPEKCPKQLLGKNAVVYLSGPMSDFPDCNRSAFRSMEEKLKKHFGVERFINPANIPADWSWEQAMEEDLRAIKEDGVTHLVLLNGWNRSSGARLEVELAIKHKILIVTEFEIDLLCRS